MSFLKKPKAPRVPKVSDQEVQNQRLRTRQAQALAKGRESTILTGSTPLGGTPRGNVSRPSIGGIQ